jgi:hypothetical protein
VNRDPFVVNETLKLLLKMQFMSYLAIPLVLSQQHTYR